MGFFSNLFKKKFVSDVERRGLISRIGGLHDKCANTDIDKSLDRLEGTISANLSREEYDSLNKQLDQLEREILTISSEKKMSRVVNRAVDSMTGAGHTLTTKEKNIELNEDTIEENSSEIDRLYIELKNIKNELDIKERKLSNIKDEDSPEYMLLDAECDMLDMKLQGIESEYTRRLESMKSSLNMNIQTKQSDQIRERYKQTDNIARQMQELDISGLEAMKEESEQVLQEQSESSEKMANLATFNKTNFSRRSRNHNKTADATQLEVEKSLGGQTMDEALSQLGSDED